MRSKNVSYDPRLDHLRALAALTVVMFHAKLEIVGHGIGAADLFQISWIDQGHVGVALFMVISGFIFSRIADQGEINVTRFYLSRALRIYPLLIAVVMMAAAVHESSAWEILSLLLPISSNFPPEAAPLWSVALELQFYLIFPFLYRRIEHYGWRGYAAVLGLLLLVRAFVYAHTGTVHHFAYFSMFGAMDAFLLGFLTNKIAGRVTLPASAPALVFVLFCAVLAIAFHGPFYHVDYRNPANLYTVSTSALWIIWPLAQAILCAALVASYMSCKWPLPRAVAWIGEISYSVYAWQNVVSYALFSHLPGHIPWLTPYGFGAICAVATIAFGAASYYVIERPFLEMRVRYLRQPSAKSVPPRAMQVAAGK
jgi:peptidoglycan/LPS O-acetylase OafA/YrhL